MAKDRIKFIPWNFGTLGVHNANVQGLDEFALHSYFNNHPLMNPLQHRHRSWTTVYLDSPGQPLDELGSGFSARLHVAGHGVTGSPNLNPPANSGAAHVTAAQVAAGIEAQGLPKRYIGTVACDNCNSALGNPSFAKMLARELWALKYYHLRVLGYEGQMVPVYVNAQHPGGVAGDYLHRTAVNAQGVRVKSRKAQRRFWGGN